MIVAGYRSALHELTLNTSANAERSPTDAVPSGAKKTQRLNDFGEEVQDEDDCCLCASAESPLPLSTRARFSGPCESSTDQLPTTGTLGLDRMYCRNSADQTSGSVVVSLNNSLDMGLHAHGTGEAFNYSVQSGRALSPATRSLLGMLQGSRITGNESDGHALVVKASEKQRAPGHTGRSPLANTHMTTSPPPPPSPTCKSEDSVLSVEEAPLRLIAHPTCDGEKSQATPVMICNFLQLSLNEPPSSTKISAETDFMAMAQQQLFVSELPTPVTQVDGTPGPSLVPGVSLQACTSGHHLSTIPTTCRSSNLCKPSPLELSAKRVMQQGGGLVSPQPCRFNNEQPTLVDAATSPGTLAHLQSSECSSRGTPSKAASEHAAVELCQSPFHGPFASTGSGTPVQMPHISTPARCMPDLGSGPLVNSVCMMADGPDGALCPGTPDFRCPADAAGYADDVARTPRLQVMGNALSPLLRDACGRNAKSVLKDLLAALVEQERALDAKGSVDRAECRLAPEIAGITPMPKYDEAEFVEETVNVVASPLQRGTSVPAPMQGHALECASTGSGLHAVNPLTFDAVYDEAVQLHLAAGMDKVETQRAEKIPLGGQGECSEDRVELHEQPIDAGHCCPGVGSLGMLLTQDQTVSPAGTRVSTFSVRSALSCDLRRGPRAVDSTADVAAWLCAGKPRASVGCKRSGKARQVVRGGHGPACRPAGGQPVSHARSTGAASTGKTAVVDSEAGAQPRVRRYVGVKHQPEVHAHAAPAWRPACGPTKGVARARSRAPALQTYAAKAAAAKRPTYDAYECFEQMLGPAKSFASRGPKASSQGYVSSGRPKGCTKDRPQGHSKAKTAKGTRRGAKPRRKAVAQAPGLLQDARLEQPTATLALAARMGYDMEYAPPGVATYTPKYGTGTPPSPLRSFFLLEPELCMNNWEQPLVSPRGSGQPQPPRPSSRSNGVTSNYGKAVHGQTAPGKPSPGRADNWGLRGNIERSGAHPTVQRSSGAVLEPAEEVRLSGAQRAENTRHDGFTFCANQPTPPSVRSVANLPAYGAKRRKQSRESLLHNDRPFVGFSSWLEVSFFTLKDVMGKVPQVPGVYEWGALPPGTHTHNDILAFYLGKAGAYASKASQTLATRFASYTKLTQDNILVGPWRPGREGVKTQLFQVLQQRGFRMFYRYRVCVAPEEPEDVEEQLLLHIDYPGNERTNKGYRQLILPDGRALHHLPKGQYL